MASSLSGSPIALSSDVAKSSCRKTIRRISLEIACPDFRRNPTVDLLFQWRLSTESSNLQQLRRAKRQQRSERGTNDANLCGGQYRARGQHTGRKEQGDRKTARRGERDDQQFTPSEVMRQ